MKINPALTTKTLLAHLHQYYSGKPYSVVLQKEEDYLDVSCNEFDLLLPDHTYHMAVKAHGMRNGRPYSHWKKYFELPESVYKELKKKLAFKGSEYVDSLSAFLSNAV